MWKLDMGRRATAKISDLCGPKIRNIFSSNVKDKVSKKSTCELPLEIWSLNLKMAQKADEVRTSEQHLSFQGFLCSFFTPP